MVRHRPVLDDLGGVVMFESQGSFGGGAFVGDFADFRKRGLHKLRGITLSPTGYTTWWRFQHVYKRRRQSVCSGGGQLVRLAQDRHQSLRCARLHQWQTKKLLNGEL